MALSEREKRLLEEMERNWYDSESDLLSPPDSKAIRPSYRSLVVGILIGLAGLAALLVAVIVAQPLVGLLGFVVMLAGVLFAMTPSKGAREGDRVSPDSADSMGDAAAGSARSARSSLTERMAERWERRSHDE